MLDQIGVWMDIVTYNPTNTLIWKYMWYNQWPYFISSHEQLTKELAIDQDLRDWITKKLEFDHLRLPRRSMNALIKEEMRMNLIRRIAISLDPNVHFIFSSYIYFSCHFTFLHFIVFPLHSCNLHFLVAYHSNLICLTRIMN